MAWKTIKFYGWRISFECDSDWDLRYESIFELTSLDKIEIEEDSTTFQKEDLQLIDLGERVTKFPTKDTPAIKRCKCRSVFSVKVNTSMFDPKNLQLHYADIVIKVGDERIDTGNKILCYVTYNGRKCKLKWHSNEGKEYQTNIWYKSPFIYDCCRFNEGLAAVELNDRWGFVDTKGKVIVPFQYDRADEFKDGLAPVELSESGWGFINKEGRLVVPCQYETVHHFYEGRAFVQEDDGTYFGFINKKGEQIIPCIHHLIWEGVGLYYNHNFSNGLVPVRKDNKWRCQCGYINENGDYVTPLKYSRAELFQEGLAAVRNKNWGFINTKGEEVISLMYSDVGYFSEGLAAVKVKQQWGFIDKTNTMVIPCKYQEVRTFSEGLAAVKVNKKWGFVDKRGNRVIPCEYRKAWHFKNGMAPVQKNKKEGFIDKEGNLVIPCIYDSVDNYGTNGLACVKLAGKMGCIDRTGRVVVPIIYDTVGNHETILTAELHEKWGFLDLAGNPIEDYTVYKELAKKYDQVYLDNGNVLTYTVVLNGKYGLVDAEGKVLIHPRYDWMADEFVNDLCLVGYRGEKGISRYINKDGREFIQQKDGE